MTYLLVLNSMTGFVVKKCVCSNNLNGKLIDLLRKVSK